MVNWIPYIAYALAAAAIMLTGSAVAHGQVDHWLRLALLVTAVWAFGQAVVDTRSVRGLGQLLPALLLLCSVLILARVVPMEVALYLIAAAAVLHVARAGRLVWVTSVLVGALWVASVTALLVLGAPYRLERLKGLFLGGPREYFEPAMPLIDGGLVVAVLFLVVTAMLVAALWVQGRWLTRRSKGNKVWSGAAAGVAVLVVLSTLLHLLSALGVTGIGVLLSYRPGAAQWTGVVLVALMLWMSCKAPETLDTHLH